ncbi:MAG: D-alanyl-D-alanine carboxypeptidase family protein [Actinomycetota bacterium]|nr:D-alanyl-D-alanine carboxypeptidase family protein [Actinomycetota bacterium]
MKRSFNDEGTQNAAQRHDDLEKRIKELRKRKRREKKLAKNHILRLLPAILLILFFTLCLSTSLFTLFSVGGNENYLTLLLPASNISEVEDLILKPGQIEEPDPPAAAAFLMDPETGEELYAKNADQPLPMASTTKIMTAVVTMENADMNESVTISENASSVGESSVWLEAGETLSIEQLLYALLVQSANDAATALAEYVGGSEEAFVKMMNQKAAELELENTHFVNPHGLDQEDHYSSAHDLAYTAAYAMRDQTFADIVVTDGYQIPWPGNPYPRVLENHNRLLQMYPYGTGIKTGYTNNAGRCLVASARKDGRELISVILNCDDYWNQTISLMNYGFDSFARVEFSYMGHPLAAVTVGMFPSREVNAVAMSDMILTVRRDRLDACLQARAYYREWLPYPVMGGQEVGYMVVGEGGYCEKSAALISDACRLKPNPLVRFFSFVGDVLGLWWKGIKLIIPGV